MERPAAHDVLGQIDGIPNAGVGAECLHLLQRDRRFRVAFDVEDGRDLVHHVVGRHPREGTGHRGPLVNVVALPNIGRLIVVLRARVPPEEHLTVTRGRDHRRRVRRARQVETHVVGRLHRLVVALHEGDARQPRRALGDHDADHHLLRIPGRHGERSARQHEAPVRRRRVEEAGPADRIPGHVEGRRLTGRRIDHRRPIAKQPLHVVVGFHRVLRAAAVRVLVERREPQRQGVAGGHHHLRALQKVVAHARRLGSVLLIVVARVVDEPHGQRGVAAHQVVGETAEVRVRPLRHVGVRERVRAAIDDLVVREHGVAEGALTAERERGLLHLDAQRPRTARAVVVRALAEVVIDRPQHLVPDDAEGPVPQHGHGRGPVRHRAGVVVGQNGVTRRRIDVPARVQVDAVQLVDLVLRLAGIIRDSAHRLPGPVVVAVLGDRDAHVSAHQRAHPQPGREDRGLPRPLRELQTGGAVLGVIGERPGVLHHHRDVVDVDALAGVLDLRPQQAPLSVCHRSRRGDRRAHHGQHECCDQRYPCGLHSKSPLAQGRGPHSRRIPFAGRSGSCAGC